MCRRNGGTIIHVESGHLKKEKGEKKERSNLRNSSPSSCKSSRFVAAQRVSRREEAKTVPLINHPRLLLVFVAEWRPSAQPSRDLPLLQCPVSVAACCKWIVKVRGRRAASFSNRREASKWSLAAVSRGLSPREHKSWEQVRASVGACTSGWWLGIAFAPLILHASLVKYLRPAWSISQ